MGVIQMTKGAELDPHYQLRTPEDNIPSAMHRFLELFDRQLRRYPPNYMQQWKEIAYDEETQREQHVVLYIYKQAFGRPNTLTHLEIAYCPEMLGNINGNDHRNMERYLLLHEQTEIWMRLLATLDDAFTQFGTQEKAHDLAIQREFVEAKHRNEIGEVLQFHEDVDTMKCGSSVGYDAVMSWLDSEDADTWPAMFMPQYEEG